MKKIFTVLFLLLAGVVLLSPWACEKHYLLSPIPTPTPTPTPPCGFTSLLTFGTPTITPVVYATVTPNPTFVIPIATPVISYPNSAFAGTVIKSLSDWQAYYGTTPVPPGLDFNKYMVLIQSFPGCCSGSGGFLNVCYSATEVEVSEYYQPWSGPYQCYTACSILEAIVVPRSDLPVVITEVETIGSAFPFYLNTQ